MEERMREFYDQLDAYYDACDYQGMEAFLMRKMRENASACAACFNPLQVTVFNELGTMYRCTGDQERSKRYFREAVNMIISGIGRESVEYATALNNLAGACRLTGEYEEAIRYFQEALQVYERLGGSGHYVYMTALNNLGLVYLETRQMGEAKACFQKVYPVMEQMNRDQGGMEPELAVTCCNMAALLYYEGNDEEAMRQVRQAIEWYEKTPENRRGHLGAVYNLQGDLYRRSGDPEKAREAYREAMRWTEKFYGKNPEYRTAEKKLKSC